MVSMFTGGALGRMGIFALGIMPYISASIIVQLLTSMVPSLEQLKKEGEQGRKKINQYTRYGTVLLATAQSYGLAVSLESGELATDPGLYFRLACMITLVGGTMFLMWLGEQITNRGIGNGISLIIFVGIIAEVPAALAQFFASGRSGALSPAVIVGVILMVVGIIMFVVFMERALRKIHIQYPRRQVGMKVYDGGSSHLPVKVNPAGVIPAIFASSLLLLPTTIATFSTDAATGPVMSWLLANFGPGQPLYLLFLCVYDRVLCVFLHVQCFVQTRRCRRQSQEPKRLCSGHSPRRKNRGISGICGQPCSGAGLCVSCSGLPVARNFARPVCNSVLLWWYFGSDRSLGYHGHNSTGSKPPACASI